MIKFFRKLRQDLLLKGKTGKYLKYAIGEIILVVIGILIALWINNWNTENAQQKEVRKYLVNIKSNLVQDTSSLRLITQSLKFSTQTIDSISRLIHNEDSEFLFDSKANFALFATHRFIPEKTSVEDLTSSGKFNLIEHKKIKEEILSYYNDIDGTINAFNNSIEVYATEVLAPYFMKNHPLEYPMDANLKFKEESSVYSESENKNTVFEMNALKYRYFMLTTLIEIYEETITNSKNIIELIDKELNK